MCLIVHVYLFFSRCDCPCEVWRSLCRPSAQCDRSPSEVANLAIPVHMRFTASNVLFDCRSQLDSDDEVRDRATFYLTILQEQQAALNSAYILNGE